MGPRLGNERDIGTEGDFLQKESASYFPDTYIDSLIKGKSLFTSDFNNNICRFKIKEIEVAFKNNVTFPLEKIKIN